jgi:hypothetical protein
MTLHLTCNAPLQALFYEALQHAAQHSTLHLQLPGLVITPWIFTAQHSICSVQHLQQWGAPPTGVYPLGAAEMLHYPTCTICSMMHHAASCC